MFRWCLSTSILTSVLVAAQVTLPAQVRSETLQTHKTLGVTFQSPTDFSKVLSLSGNTSGIVYPANSDLEPQMIVRFAEIESDPDNWVQFSPQETMMYTRYRFLGSNNPSAETRQRTFFGKPLTGEVQTRRTRSGYHYIELYIVPLENSKRHLAIAFESDTRLPLEKVETTINTVTQSLSEVAQPSKKKKKSKS